MALLKLSDALLTGAPVKKEIRFIDGVSGEEVTADIYVKQLGIAQARSLMAIYSTQAKGEEAELQADKQLARTIAQAVTDEKGEPLFSADDVLKFKQDLILALLAAIAEINDPKNLPKKKKSTAN
ncbi:phage tail assembly chaperone family protein, TAC [Suttonella ornithocola]|uniref:Phage tail assembly chaperone protein, TAC n=1 Tax=Suttonella ornithocola TaxID=279832 RepID=A0A380MSJ9_9GAMM|nr:phage tail assembly chaperone family protein, TAC [Suttonella ornithocola]SUO95268.1 Uncharacterised protein [Suttonella ornithocola]